MSDDPSIRYPDPPAQVEVYVAVLGCDLTIDFLLTFGGTELYLTETPKDRSRLVALVGKEKAAALGRQAHLLQRRVPLAKPWLAACLGARGLSVAEIARTLRVTDVSVRGWLRADKRREPG